ncbi:MAG: monovalent cation/H(+) antiporter subunit G [Lachnospiraceae bacterium]|nr:monovalent cation/H(+) antiporter subunit G [Lachnospiraceae bacterium]
MQVLEWVRFIVGAGMLLCGLGIFLIEVYGVFHLDYVLNRMHAAAMGDTLGISFSLIGLMIFCGLNFTTLKLALIVIFFWFASPVCSHMLSRLEVTTNENLKEHCVIYDDLEQLEDELKNIKSEKEPLDEASEGRQL